MATIADVAALAGVSKATASRAFGRPDLVSDATARRVRDAAEKLGYVPNSAARHLAGGRTGMVAFLVPTLLNAFFAPIIGGAQRRVADAGLHLTVVVNALETVDDLAVLERLAQQVDGLILVAPRGPDEIVSAAARRAPAVLVDREIDGIASVVADTAAAFGTLVERFASAGHERLVYLGGPAGSWQDRQRTAAVRAAAARAGASIDVLGPFESTFAAGIAAAPAVRASGATAVIPYATAIGLGVQFSFLSDGAPAPVVSSERAIVDALSLEDAPAIDVDGEELGDTAAELLVGRIAGSVEEHERRRLPVPVRWTGAAAT